MATPERPNNYSHWLFDLLPRVLAIRQANDGFNSFDHVVVNLSNFPFCQESLRILGLPLEKILPLDGSVSYKIDECVTTSLRDAHWRDSLSLEEFQLVRQNLIKAADTKSSFPKRLFLPRGGAKFRKLMNEEELAPILRANGFHDFYPERYSMAEQIAAFEGAEIIVGAHSSAFSNLLFCQAGTVVLEIFPPNHTDFSWWTLSDHGKLKYFSVLGSGVTNLALSSGRSHDLGNRYLHFKVDINAFTRALTNALSCLD